MISTNYLKLLKLKSLETYFHENFTSYKGNIIKRNAYLRSKNIEIFFYTWKYTENSTVESTIYIYIYKYK